MTNPDSSRPEAALVLMLMQATFWVAAALSALPFTLGGEVFMPVLSIATFGLAAATIGLAIGLIHRRPGARRWSLALESLCLAGALVQQVAPIGANHGSVALLVNVVLPSIVIVLIRGRHMRAHFRNNAASGAVHRVG